MLDRDQIQRWMTAAADGDRTAVEPLFRALWAPLVRYAERFCGELAEDAVQEALVKLFGQLDAFDRERDALAWAFTLVTWSARTARRTRERRGETSGLPEGSASPIVEDRDLVRAALAELEALPARDREIIEAALFDDRELRTQLAPATFRKRLERALARLRTGWRSRHGTL